MLTKTQIDAAIRDCEGETVLYDGNRQRGEGSLRLRIRKSDTNVTATWFAHWQKAGARGKKQIGFYPEMTLAAARTKYTEAVRPVVKESEQPKAVMAAQEILPTVEHLFEEYVAHLKARDAGSAGGLDTELIPWHAGRAGTTSKWSAPVVGEQGIVFAPGGETTNGFFLGGFYQQNMPAPSTNPNVEMTQFPDGSTVQYDSGSNTLTVNVSGNGNVVVNCKVATVNSSTSVTLNTPQTHMTGNVQVDGNLGVTGVMAVQGNGSSGGAVSTFAGTIQVTGGDVKADAIGLKTHHHTAQGSNAATTAAQA